MQMQAAPVQEELHQGSSTTVMMIRMPMKKQAQSQYNGIKVQSSYYYCTIYVKHAENFEKQ